MVKSKHTTKLPSWAEEKLRALYACIQTLVVADRLWSQKFTKSDRSLLGGSLEKAYEDYKGTVGMWQKVNGGTLARATIEVAHTLGFILETDYQSLLDALGEHLGNSEIDRAIIEKHLVLIENPQDANLETVTLSW